VPWNQVDNDDNGSLFTGELRLREGDLIQVQGEPSPRGVTYVMGSDRKGWRVCTRGCGAFPYGPVRWRVVQGGAGAPPLAGDLASAGDGGNMVDVGPRSARSRVRRECNRARGQVRLGSADTQHGRLSPLPPAEVGGSSTSGIGTHDFERYIGIDYSGAQTPTAGLKGLRVYMADQVSSPGEQQPPSSPGKYWTRRGIAGWLVERLSEHRPTLVGIDHGFSFPLRYFETYRLPHDWPAFLDDFRHHWPTDEDNTYVDFVREGICGNGAARLGDAHWRRITDVRAGAAKSVFHFDVPGSVAKATHGGLPWLLYLRRQLGGRVHFWPFDGWDIAARQSVIAEVYPSLWNRSFARDARSGDQHDAYSVAAWMRRADHDRSLPEFFQPSLTPAEREAARIEGWILGIK